MICFFVASGSFARDLTVEERLALTGYERAQQVMSYMGQEVDPRLLGLRQRLNFEVAKRSCQPLESLLHLIEQSTELEDQSRAITGLMYACLTGVVQVTDYYRLQRD